jgi:cytoskeletal protein RodZ
MDQKSSWSGLYQNFTVTKIRGSVGIDSKKLFQNESSDADPENNDARLIPADAIGAYLQEKRISQNIGLEEVSEATGISTGVLKTLENNDREQFPAEVYIRAFHKKYAEYLGLDPEEILSVYQQQSQKQSKTGGRFNLSAVIMLQGQEKRLFDKIVRRLFVPIIVVLGGILLYWIYSNYL